MTRITDLTTANTATITDLIVPVVNISSSTTGVTEKLSVAQLVELSSGPQGITGYIGSRGSMGYAGSVGTAGSTGYIGSAGASAAIGYSGSTGIVFQRSTAPTSSIGEAGDRKGDIAYDNTYFYYCIANYTGSIHIWKRIEWTGSTW